MERNVSLQTPLFPHFADGSQSHCISYFSATRILDRP